MDTNTPAQRRPFSVPSPRVTPLRWGIILLAEAASVAVLLLVDSRFISVPIYTFVPLLTLVFLARDMLRASLRLPRLRHIFLGVGLGMAALLVTMGVATLLQGVMATAGNPMNAVLASQGLGQNLVTLFLNVIQLFGEEVMTFVVFMPVLQVCGRFLKGERAPTVIAWVVSSVVFALVHLPTYGYNVVQVLLVIGVARMILSLGFIFTNNLVVSYISHIIDDNVIFIFTIIAASM